MAFSAYSSACTNFIVGKKASADGSVICTYNADDYGWLRSSLSNSSTTLSPSSDIVSTSTLFSGGSTRYTTYSLTTGNILIENTSSAPKTYYYYAWGEFSGTSANKFFTNFGGSGWGEDMLYAIPVN